MDQSRMKEFAAILMEVHGATGATVMEQCGATAEGSDFTYWCSVNIKGACYGKYGETPEKALIGALEDWGQKGLHAVPAEKKEA